MNMRIIYAAQMRLPTEKAHGFQIMKMCEQFSENGARVTLIVPRTLNSIKKDPFDFYSVRKIFDIEYIGIHDALRSFTAFKGPAFLYNTLQFIFKFLAVAWRSDRDTVVYSRDLIVLWWCAIFLNRKFVIELHAIPRKSWLYGPVFRKASAIIVLTSSMKNILTDYGIDFSKIIISPDAVDLDEFKKVESLTRKEIRKNLEIPVESFVVGYVGRFTTLDEKKGIDEIIKALGDVPQNIIAVFVGGDASEIKTAQMLAEREGVLLRCIFIPFQPKEKIPYILRSFDLALMPFPFTKHYAHYMSPLKMFEYMAAGLPIIASDLPSVRDVLSENNALLIQPGSIKDLSAAIRYAESHPVEIAKIAVNAYNSAKNYTWSERAGKILSFLNAVR